MYALLLLWIVSIISFWLSKQVPGDAVMDYISIDDRSYHTSVTPVENRKAYKRVAHQRGLDIPEFYFSISTRMISDSIQQILPVDDRNIVKEWIYETKQGKKSYELYRQLISGLNESCEQQNATSADARLCLFYSQSLSIADVRIIHEHAKSLINILLTDTSIQQKSLDRLRLISNTFDDLINGSNKFSGIQWFPDLRWNGSQNQYHQWMTGLFLQRPLTSLVDGRNAWSKIYSALKWTLLLNGFAFLLSIILGIFIGIWSGTHDGQRGERFLNWILFALFALPSFWLGTLFIYFLTSGEWLSILPAGGLGSHQVAGSAVERGMILFSHLLLPVLCLALGSLAYVSRQVKQSILHEFDQPYVGTLRAQGISEKTIVRRHVIRNALFPVITMIGGAIPALLSGSLVIEVIFSIPGMGRLMYNSLLSRDWPVAFPILMLCAVITIFSYILTDIIYKWVDPRVKVMQS